MSFDIRPEQQTAQRLLIVLRRRAWILIPCTLIGAIAAFGAAKAQTPKYTATATLLFQPNTLSQQLFGYSVYQVQDATTEQATNLELVQQVGVSQATASALGLSSTRVFSEINAEGVGSSNVVSVAASDPSPAMAQRIANTYVAQFVQYRASTERAQVVQAANQVSQQLQQLKNSDAPASAVATLQSRLSQMTVLESVQTGDVQVAQQALLPRHASSPKTRQDILIGLIAGLLVGMFATLFAERIDQKLREPEEARQIIDLPILGAIPGSRLLSRSGGDRAAPSSAERDAFRLLRAQLRYFNVDRTIKSVMVTSASPGDGKSTVAWNLARAAASVAANPRVLIVDADLRRPVIAGMAQLGPGPGLSEVLTKEAALSEAIQRVTIEDEQGEPIGRIDVLPAGGDAPNPAELMESTRLSDLVRGLEGAYDFIVFDAAPTSIVSDAIPLMTRVSGLLVVVRMRRTRRTALRRLREQIQDVNARPLGLVLNDVRGSESGYYDYGYGYGDSSSSRGSKGVRSRADRRSRRAAVEDLDFPDAAERPYSRQ